MKITTAYSHTDVDAWLAEQVGSLGLATLTVGMDPHAATFAFKSFALGTPEGAALVIDAVDPMLITHAMKQTLGAGRRVYAHQARDISWGLVQTAGLRVTPLLCTMVAAQTVYPGRKEGYSLASLRPAVKDSLDRIRVLSRAHEQAPIKTWLPDFLRNTNSQSDVVRSTVAIMAIETAALARQVMTSEYRPAIDARLEVEQVWRWQGFDGIHIDRAATTAAAGRIRVAFSQATRRLGFDALDPVAAKAWALRKGIQLPKTRDGVTLERARLDEAKVPDEMVSEWKDFLHTRGMATFTGKLKELSEAVDQNGVLHPEIRIFTENASTGRMAVSKPALQNLSNAELEGTGLRTLRNCLIAAPGKVLVSCDLAHVEPSVLAAITGDEALKKAVSREADVYVETAVVLWGEEARTDLEARKRAKTILLALLYGKADRTLAMDLGWAVERAGKAKKQLLGGYPKVAQWMQKVTEQAKAGEVMLTAFGRPVANRGSSEAYKIVNYLIQGAAADLLCEMTVRLADNLDVQHPTARLWLPVHDELVVECDDKDAGAVRTVLETCMTTTLEGVEIWGEARILGPIWDK